MPTKKKRLTTKKKPTKGNPLLDRLPKTQEEYLQHLIQVSERQITGMSESLDELFRTQAERIKNQLKELKTK